MSDSPNAITESKKKFYARVFRYNDLARKYPPMCPRLKGWTEGERAILAWDRTKDAMSMFDRVNFLSGEEEFADVQTQKSIVRENSSPRFNMRRMLEGVMEESPESRALLLNLGILDAANCEKVFPSYKRANLSDEEIVEIYQEQLGRIQDEYFSQL